MCGVEGQRLARPNRSSGPFGRLDMLRISTFVIIGMLGLADLAHSVPTSSSMPASRQRAALTSWLGAVASEVVASVPNDAASLTRRTLLARTSSSSCKSTTTTTTVNGVTTTTTKNCKSKVALIAGIVAGVAVLVGLTVCVCCWWRKRRAQQHGTDVHPADKADGSPDSSHHDHQQLIPPAQPYTTYQPYPPPQPGQQPYPYPPQPYQAGQPYPPPQQPYPTGQPYQPYPPPPPQPYQPYPAAAYQSGAPYPPPTHAEGVPVGKP